MKKFLLVLVIIIVAAVAIFYWFSGKYNNMVAKQEETSKQWAQVENVYQRRADLIPNLVNTVRGAANFERGTLTDVISARAKASSIQVDPTKLSAEQVQAFDQAQGGLSQALGRLLVTVEKYPDLKANANFRDLQAQLEGTENRIAVERNRFNEVAQDYNTYIKQIPNNIVANFSNFDAKGYFQSTPGSEKPPTVDFNGGQNNN